MFSAGEFYKDKIGSYPDVTIYLSMHAVNRRTDHIDKALNVLRINESDIRLSVGLEDVEDLKADLQAAFDTL